jgi:sporulation protein YlmC with PRC-barrel domain
MLRPATEIRGLTIHATDGEIGSVQDLFFDDDRWTVRYVVVDTGTLLPGRRVLVSPLAVTGADWDARRLDVRLTRAQVGDSPDIETERPVSRQEQRRQERAYHDYYGWPYYWGGVGLWGAMNLPAALMGPAAAWVPDARPADPTEAAVREDEAAGGDRHLRSVAEVTGYRIEATDGEIGHVEDFLVDDESWAVRYMVVDTSNWWVGRKVLVAPDWIREIRWADQRVRVDLTRDAVKAAPAYDPTVPLDRALEERLWRSHGREGHRTEGAAPRRRRG